MNVSNARLYRFPTNILKQMKFRSLKKDLVFNHEVIKTNNPNCESQYAKLQQMSNQQATVNEQPSSQINRNKQVPFGLLLPILIPQLAKDKAMQLTTLFNKLKKDEIPKDHFVRLMKGIVGDQMLRIALTKVKQQTKANAGSSGQQHPVRMPTVTSSGTKFNDPHALAQLHQRSMNPAADHSHNTSSAIQVKSEPTYSTMDIGAKKSLEHDVRVVQPNQLPSSGSNAVNQETERSSVHIQGLNKHQQQHIHFPSTYGSSGGNYNHFSGTTTGSSSLRPQPHPHDSHIRQIPHQNIGLNHLGVERQSSFTDPKRMPGGSASTGVNNTAPQQTSTSWQPSAEQNSGLFSSVSYVKKEPNDLSIEQQHRNHLSKLHGLPSVNSGQTEQGASKAKDNSNSVKEVNTASNGGVTIECGSSEKLRHLKKVGAPLAVPFETANGKTSNAGVRTDSPELFAADAATKTTPVVVPFQSAGKRPKKPVNEVTPVVHTKKRGRPPKVDSSSETIRDLVAYSREHSGLSCTGAGIREGGPMQRCQGLREIRGSYLCAREQHTNRSSLKCRILRYFLGGCGHSVRSAKVHFIRMFSVQVEIVQFFYRRKKAQKDMAEARVQLDRWNF
ncbi:unnamed protein product [Vicia faba]|uniref:RST domain-containing protein n=1 Tax=Vicia faba TaxID=3906 RepID=A0AAV0ZM13_VICFA|nr:unnamed protein product [Vicia faba]